jgi:putative sterol carrier protein
MAAEIFTGEWAEIWSQKINGNQAYRDAATKWEGAVALIMTPDESMGIPAERFVVADLWHGECRGATAGVKAELEEAPYKIQAGPAAWKDVLAGKTDPIVGLTIGKLKLVRGGMFALLPYAKAAKELVASAIAVETDYPEGW